MALTTLSFDRLMPMHLQVDREGVIRHVGPTLAKVCGDLSGLLIIDVLQIDRPKGRADPSDLPRLVGRRLHVTLRSIDGADQDLCGTVQPCVPEGFLLDFAFGKTVLDSVQRHALTMSDFAPCDPTLDMLFVIEANAAAQRESAELNARLDSARLHAETLAATDKLTGLRNRRALDAHLGDMTEPVHPDGFGLMNIDLDFFKAVNDTHGHAAGDHVLRVVADVLRQEVRRGDVVARVGGDEFVLLFPGCLDTAVLDRIAQRIIKRIQKPIDFEGIDCRISASVGTTVSSFYPSPTAEQMLADADEALYTSKHAGRATHTIYTPKAESAAPSS